MFFFGTENKIWFGCIRFRYGFERQYMSGFSEFYLMQPICQEVIVLTDQNSNLELIDIQVLIDLSLVPVK